MLRLAAWGGGGAALAFTLMMLIGKLISDAPSDTEGATPDQAIAGRDAITGRHASSASRASDEDALQPDLQGVSINDLPVEEQEERKRAKRIQQRMAPAPPVPAAPTKPAWLQQVAE